MPCGPWGGEAGVVTCDKTASCATLLAESVVTVCVLARWEQPLSQLAQCGAQQGGIGGPRPSQGVGIGDQVDQGIAVANGAPIAQLGPLNAQPLRLAIDAFGRGALLVDDLVERGVALERDAHLGTLLAVEVLDTAAAFGELLVVTALSRWLRIKQGTRKALGAIAVGVLEALGRLHTQALGTQGDAIGITSALRMAMGVEGDGGHPTAMQHRLIDVPGIKGGIGRDIVGKVAQVDDRLQVQGKEVGDIVLVEGQGVLGQDDIAIASHNGTGDPRAVAPQILFLFFDRAIGLLLIGGAFDAHVAVRVAFGLAVFAIAVFHRDPGIIFLDPGIEVLHVEGHRFAQAGDVLFESQHRGMQEIL